MQEVEQQQRPVKKRRFFVEDDSEVIEDTRRWRKSPSPSHNSVMINGAESGKAATGSNSVTNGVIAGGTSGVAGGGDGESDEVNGQERLDPHAFRAVVGEDVSDDVIESIKEMSGDNLTRG